MATCTVDCELCNVKLISYASAKRHLWKVHCADAPDWLNEAVENELAMKTENKRIKRRLDYRQSTLEAALPAHSDDHDENIVYDHTAIKKRKHMENKQLLFSRMSNDVAAYINNKADIEQGIDVVVQSAYM
jgi:hypothetical protein